MESRMESRSWFGGGFGAELLDVGLASLGILVAGLLGGVLFSLWLSI
jgi:hypothetical protein